MSYDEGLSPDLRQQLDHIIAQCLAGLRAGVPPDREALLTRYPSLADHLRTFFAAQDAQIPGEGPYAPTLPAADEEPRPLPQDGATIAGGPIAGSDATMPLSKSPTAGGERTATGAQADHFGDYLLLEPIARGGMGVVFKAKQVSLNRVVALKMILAGQLASEADVQRFHAEAEAAAHLDHPGIVPIHEVGQHAGQHYYCMGFVEGRSLARRVADGPLPPCEAAELVRKVAETVAYAHAHGVIHRDLKPGNILLDLQGQPRVTDFGLAKRVEGDSSLTATGQVLGTPSYMPPEQAAGRTEEVGPLADVYSLGAVLYTLLIGRPPFQAATVVETLRQVLEREPVSPRQLNHGIDRDLETICLKCLQKEPARRYRSAAALADDLRRYLNGEPIQARPVSTAERAWRWCRRNPEVAKLLTAVAALLVMLMAGAIIAAVVFKQAHDQEKVSRHRAEGLAQDNRLKVYAARINLAQQAWEIGDIGRAVELLESLRPEAGEEDLRGFEWFYLWRLCHSERLSLAGHVGPVRCVAVAPDGQTLATAANDRTVKLWDLNTGEERRVLEGHAGWITSVAFAPDGKTLASGSVDQTVRLWDVATGKELATLHGHTVPVSSVVFAPDGLTLASGGAEVAVASFSPLSRFYGPKQGEVKLWAVATRKEKATLQGHTAGVVAVAFAPDGRALATASYDKTVKLWDVESGERRQTFEGHQGPVFSLAFAPNGTLLASAGYDQTVKLWDVRTGELRGTLPGHRSAIFSVAFAPNGRRLVTASADQTVKLWNIATQQEQASIKGHTGYVSSAVYTPDGRTLVTGSWDGTVKLWEVTKAQPSQAIKAHLAGTNSLAITPDGKVVASAGFDKIVKFWNLATGRELARLQAHTSGIQYVAYAPVGNTMATGSWDGSVKLWDAATGKERATCQGHTDKIWCLAFSPDGKTLATSSKDGTVKLWDANTGEQLANWEAKAGEIRFLAFAPDGRTLATASHPQEHRSVLKLWDVATGQVRAALEPHTDFLEWIAFAPDGKTFATGSWDRTVKLWDAATLEERATLKGHLDVIFHGVFAPDGRTLATASWDGTVKLWHVPTMQELLTLRGPPCEFAHVAFSHDGRTLAAASNLRDVATTGVVTLWRGAARDALPLPGEPAAEQERASLADSTDQVWCLAFSRDGKTLAAACEDGTVKFWDVATKKERMTLKGHVGRVRSLAFAPDDRLLATAGEDGTVKLWDTLTGEDLTTLRGHTKLVKLVNSVAFAPDGETLATGSLDGTVKLWDLATEKELTTLKGHTDWVLSVAFAPDGKTLASASRDRSVKVWDVTSGTEKATLQGHSNAVEVVLFTPDGKTLLSGSWDGSVKLWDTATWKEQITLRKPFAVHSLALSPDGKTFAVGDSRGTVHVWDLDTKHELAAFKGHTLKVWGLAFSPDGKTLASGSAEWRKPGEPSQIKLWNAAKLRERQTAKQTDK